MAQIRPVTSEALEAFIRDNLPSQNGFGEDLQASNVIMPVLDVTSVASTTQTPEILQTALAFGSQTAFSQVGAGTTVIVNTPGFWRIVASANGSTANALQTVNLSLSDGLSTKIVWQMGNYQSFGASYPISVNIDLIFFLAAGESLSTTCSTNNYTSMVGSSRQIADVNGVLVYPSGFTPQ